MRLARMLPAVVFSLTFACFLPALGNGFVAWDDDVNLTGNPRFRGLSAAHLRWMFTTVHGGHYQPLTWVSFAVDNALWGMNPTGYHLTSIVLHAANAALFYGLVVMLLRRAGRVDGPGLRLAATAGALFFALHPLRVESVAWATERRDVLCGFFYLLTLIAYVRMLSSTARARWLLVSLACFALSLLSKAWGITLPAVLLVLDWYPLRRLHEAPRTVLLEKTPHVALAVVAAVVATRAVGEAPLFRTLAEHGIVQRLAQSAYALCFYVWETVFPHGLSPLYRLEPHVDPASPRYLASMAAVLCTAAALIALRRRWPWATAAGACYAIIVSPVLGLLQVGPQLAADRYTYLATLPFAVLAAAALDVARTRAGGPAALLAAAALVGLAVLTVRQTRVWRDSMTLWEHALRVDPRNATAHVNRGRARQERGDSVGAVEDFNAALALNPRDALAYNNRGVLRQRFGDLDGAIADYSAAIREHPGYATAHHNRGVAWQAKGNRAAAKADFTEAIRLRPDDPPSYVNRANLRRAESDLDGAIEDYRSAVRVAPPGWPGCGGVRKALEELGVEGPPCGS